MSDTSQGPGWWLAADGKWYPPQPPPPAAAEDPPPPGPGPGYPSAPPAAPVKKSGKGCLIALFVVIGLFTLGGIGVVVLITVFADDVVKNAFGGGPCPWLTDSEAAAALGDGTTAIETSGLSSVLVLIDARVMPTEESCALSNSSSDAGGLGRAARYKGPEAAKKYEDELITARGITEDRDGGLSVTSDEYLNTELDGFGDEAFCTKSSGVGAGVLVREGDTLVYVSVVADAATPPGLDFEDPDNPKLGTDDYHCELAQSIARDILDK